MGGFEDEPHVFMREKRSDDCFLPRKLNTGMLSMDLEADYEVDGLILSPRVLHFTHSEVVWHCRTKWDCECGATGLGGSYVRNFNAVIQDVPNYDEKDEFSHSVQWPEIKAADPLRSWYGIVSVFTSNQITHREDVLPALSGTAKKLARLKGGRYVAGLWEDSIAHDLSWTVVTTDRSSRTDTYIEPSFSWCSCVSRIEWPNWTHTCKPLLQVLGPPSTIGGTNPTGKVSSAFMKVKGLLTKAQPTIQTPRLQVLELSSTTDGMDPTGKVSSAFMKVRGRLTKAHLIIQARPRRRTLGDLLREHGMEDGDMGASLEASEDSDATDLTPGGPRTTTHCAIIRASKIPSVNGGILHGTGCILDTVDDVCYASVCRARESDGSQCGCCDAGSSRHPDRVHPKDLCTDKNLVYCLRILECDRKQYKVFVALVLVLSSNTGPKKFRRIGIAYDMVKGFFRDGRKQEFTIV